MSDYEEFENDVKQIKPQLEAFIEKWYGEKCPDYEKNCECCKLWLALMKLVENPFDCE